MRYGRNIFGVTSDGESFDLWAPSDVDPFEYALTYARSVSGTNEVISDRAEGWIRAFGEHYSESLRLNVLNA